MICGGLCDILLEDGGVVWVGSAGGVEFRSSTGGRRGERLSPEPAVWSARRVEDGRRGDSRENQGLKGGNNVESMV